MALGAAYVAVFATVSIAVFRRRELGAYSPALAATHGNLEVIVPASVVQRR